MRFPANGWRWIAALGLGAFTGLASVFTDPMFPGWWDIFRHCGLGMISTAVALKMTLQPAAQDSPAEPPQQSKKAAA
jgi:hypothetical protein